MLFNIFFCTVFYNFFPFVLLKFFLFFKKRIQRRLVEFNCTDDDGTFVISLHSYKRLKRVFVITKFTLQLDYNDPFL